MCKVNSPLFGRTSILGRPGHPGEAHWVPNTDVFVAEHQLVIAVELAGMRRADLELKVDGNRLMISGHRPDGCRTPKCKFLVMEINYGPFECVFEIPAGYNLGEAKAAYQNGFLRIEVPQALHTSSKKTLVPISEGG
jgi:HSP20 family protein